MTGRNIVLTLACLTAAVATLAAVAPRSASPQLPASDPAPAATVAPGNRPTAEVRWLAGYGTYDPRQGSWSLFRQELWRFLPNPDGC